MYRAVGVSFLAFYWKKGDRIGTKTLLSVQFLAGKIVFLAELKVYINLIFKKVMRSVHACFKTLPLVLLFLSALDSRAVAIGDDSKSVFHS